MTSPQHIHIAHGAFEQQLAPIVEAFGARKIMLVTGKASFEGSGAAAIVRQQIGNRVATQFTDFDKNPTITDVENGVAQIRHQKPDLILAVGGGSALDVAKQINLCATNPLPPRDYITGKAKPESPGLPLIACPTTAGTGSEATHFAVCYDGMDKYSFAHPRMKPDAVIVDPSLANSLPAYQAACCAFDALSQLIESFWAVGATDESRSYSEEGLSLILPAIKPSIFEGNQFARLQMAKAAYLSGKAIDIAKTTAAHALSYPIAQIFGLPHGHAVALTLPELLLLNAHTTDDNCTHPNGTTFVVETISKIGSHLNHSTPESTMKALNKLIVEIGLSRDKSKLGLDQKEKAETILSHINKQRLGNNPRELSFTEIHNMIRTY